MDSKCFSCKNKNVETSFGYTACNYSGFECRNFELYDPIKKTNGDNFRAMTDEELARFLTYQTESCLSAEGNDWLDWLRQECE